MTEGGGLATTDKRGTRRILWARAQISLAISWATSHEEWSLFGEARSRRHFPDKEVSEENQREVEGEETMRVRLSRVVIGRRTSTLADR